jgi:hypothetical protein
MYDAPHIIKVEELRKIMETDFLYMPSHDQDGFKGEPYRVWEAFAEMAGLAR